MTDRTALASVLFAMLVVVGVAVPAMALSTNTGEPTTSHLTGASVEATGQTDSADQTTQTEPATQTAQTNSRVSARVGPQLSTLIDASSDEVQTDFGNTAFELSVEGASDDAQADAIADRADNLRDRAEAIRDDYDEATEAYEDDEITRAEYARRLAVLNARATNLLNSYEQLRQRAATIPTADLRAAGVTQSALNKSIENLSSVTGTGATALRKQFTGESEGEIEVEFENGLSIEVKSEDGERYREFDRPRDTSNHLTVSQATALETARGTLSSVDGTWVLTDSEIDEDDGSYEFEFVLRNAPTLTGEAEVSVDGSSGEVFELDEEIERRDSETADDADNEADDGVADDDERDDERDDELEIVVTEGTPGPNEQITIQVLANGDPAETVTVSVNDRVVGQTNADGLLTVTLPATDKVEITAETEDAKAELELEFDEAEETDDAEATTAESDEDAEDDD